MSVQSAARPAGSFFVNLFNRTKSAFSRSRETSRLDVREIDALARDLNISSPELVPSMFIAPAPFELLNKRLAYAALRSLSREACQLRPAQVLAFPMKLS